MLTSAFRELLVCHIGEVAPLEVARETTEVRIDGIGRELVLIVAQHGTVYHQISHPHTHKRSTSRGLKYCATCITILYYSTCVPQAGSVDGLAT